MGKRIWMWGAAAIACAAALLSTPAAAQPPVYPVYHYQPAPRPVWVPGHWEWQGNRHAWVHGHYEQPYHDGRRARRRDRDHDGIPDRYDRDLDNDGVHNRHDRDRDGDGVRNRHDRAPDNRYRR